jgi:hypothetical protein
MMFGRRAISANCSICSTSNGASLFHPAHQSVYVRCTPTADIPRSAPMPDITARPGGWVTLRVTA